MTEPEDDDPTPISDAEWNARRLCSDGSCVGTIGPDGTCRVCGTPYEGEDLPELPVAPEATQSSDDPEDDETPPAEAPSEDIEERDADDAGETDDWEDRKLCPDGTCIGTIGEDGHCRVCGLSHDAEV